MGKYAKISAFNGQFGNHIQQISNAIYYCLEKGIGFKFENVQPLDSYHMFNNFTMEGKETDLVSSFFSIGEDRIEDLPLENYENFIRSKKEICEKIVFPLIPKHDHHGHKYDYEEISDDALVIHFRGGDVWDTNYGVHPHYSPFPYSFIKEVSEQYDDIVVVCQDLTSPILNAFVSESQKEIKIISGELFSDMNFLMNAKNLVQTGVGTFLPAIALMSNKVKNYYTCDNILKSQLNYKFLEPHINVHVTEVDDSVSFLGVENGQSNWEASEEQVKILLEN